MVLHTPEKRFSSKPKLVFLKGYDNLARIRFSNDSEKANFCLKKQRTHTFQKSLLYPNLGSAGQKSYTISTAVQILTNCKQYFNRFPLQLDPTEIKREPLKIFKDLQKSMINWVFGVINGELCINEIDNNLKPKWFFFFLIKIAYHKIVLNSEILSR